MIKLTPTNPDRLYELLPSMYRMADVEKGFPLRALLRLIGGQADLLHADVERLLENFFVETCERWVIPYIGDLVSNNLLHDIDLSAAAATAESLFPDLAGPDLRPPFAIPLRADVAKTIYYRRRKGTPAMLEEMARDVTGWAAHLVEFFELLTWNQNLNHLRFHSTNAMELRRVEPCTRVDGPWDGASHTVDVRRIAQAEGWYNIRNIGFFLWRLGAYPMSLVVPQTIGAGNWRFTFSPLGNSAPLFTNAAPERNQVELAEELNVPAPVRPAAFFEDLRAAFLMVPVPLTTSYYGDPDTSWASFAVFEDTGAGPVPVNAADVRCANLGNWALLAQPADNLVRIDPTRGRLIIGSTRAAARILVSYSYGYSADMGGGPYARRKWLLNVPGATRLTVGPTGTHATLDAALATWALTPGTDTVIEILDNASYVLTNPITLDPNAWLMIQAADEQRPDIRPVGGILRITGAAAGSALTLSGLLVEGGVVVEQDISRLRLLHTTLVPGRSIIEETVGGPSGPGIDVAETGAGGAPINAKLRVEIAFSITGPIRMPAHAEGLWLLDSIVDGRSQVGAARVTAICDAAGTSGPPATIERSTVVGKTLFRQLHLASESIFTGDLQVQRQQDGCVRFSFVTTGSVTPRQYRCQPSLEIQTRMDRQREDSIATGIPLPPGWELVLANAIDAWMVPSFTAEDYGLPGYAQLRQTTPPQIRTGAEDGSEMGVFNHLKQPQRATNLRIRLEEYLPFGLDSGLIYVT